MQKAAMSKPTVLIAAVLCALTISSCSDSKKAITAASGAKTVVTSATATSDTDPAIVVNDTTETKTTVETQVGGTTGPPPTADTQVDNTIDPATAPGAGSDFCNAIEALSSSSDELDQVYSGNDKAVSKEVFEQFMVELATLNDVAPTDLQPDIVLVSQGFEALGKMLVNSDYDLQAAMSDTANSAAIELFDGPDVNAAGDRIDAYSNEQCGFTVSD
jgi:hypothetical protein